MKKIIKFLLPLVLLFSSCGNTNFKKETTVILNVTSNVTPNFSANFGEGSYENNVYTHHISCFKDLYIYLSYEGLKTETVYIPTVEMTSSTITKDIVFGNSLETKVVVTADRIDDISLAELKTDNKINSTSFDSKNKKKMTITFASRKEDIDFTYHLNGYRDVNIHIDSSDIAGGLYNSTAFFIKNNETCVSVTQGSVNIYDYDTNAFIKEIYSGSNNSYYMLDSNKRYYVSYYDAALNCEVSRLVDHENGLNVNCHRVEEGAKYIGYLGIKDNNQQEITYNYQILLINHSKHCIFRTNHCYDTFNDYSLLAANYFNPEKVYYIKNLAEAGLEQRYISEGNVGYFLKESTLLSSPTITVDSKGYNYLAKDNLIFSNHDLGSVGYQSTDYVIEENKISISCQRLMLPVKITIKDLAGNVIDNYNQGYSSNNVSYIKEIDGNKVFINFSIFLDQLSYDKANNCFNYPDVIIDTSKKYIYVYDSKNQYKITITSAYDSTASSNVVVINNQYFEPIIDHQYIIKSYEDTYNVTVGKIDIDSGYCFINGVPDYTINYMKESKTDFKTFESTFIYPGENDSYYVRSGEYSLHFSIIYSKGLLNDEYSFYLANGTNSNRTFNLIPYFGRGLQSLYVDNVYSSRDRYIYPTYHDNTLFSLVPIMGGAIVNLTRDNFVYNEALNCYALNGVNYKAFKLSYIDVYSLECDAPIYSSNQTLYYVPTSATITYNAHQYSLKDEARNYMKISPDSDGGLSFSDYIE
ncbi:MAG: hypothetical protein K5906_03935 [Bacilli bacterium]|nr:hypothetical protein [Bacilli bacterium]